MRQILGVMVALCMTCACVSSTTVTGPDGAESHLIQCSGSMEGCLEEARDVCGGDYQIETSSSNTKGDFSGDRQEILVTCGGAPLSERLQPKTEARRSEFAGSEPPDGAGGVDLGVSRDSARAKCEEASYEWKATGETATCSGLMSEVGYPGTLRVKFCDDKVCEVRLKLALVGSTGGDLFGEYTKLHGVLVEKYGRPQHVIAQVNSDCQRDIVRCLSDDSAKLRSIWRWSNGVRLTLRVLEEHGSGVTYLDYVSVKQAKSTGL